MDSLPFYLLLVVALLDIVVAAWFIGQGLRAGADSPQGRPRLLIGGTMITGAILIAGLAFFLFGPFG
jgi:hypothetical protein